MPIAIGNVKSPGFRFTLEILLMLLSLILIERGDS